MASTVATRQEHLIAVNLHSLRQALRLLDRLDDCTFRESPAGFAPHRVGGHLRHVLEFYECFLAGLEWSHIDYDARQRDEAVETSRAAAMAKIRYIIYELETNAGLRGDSIVWVRMEDCPDNAGGDPFLTSSLGRELQVLASHTTHPFALIAVTLQAHGVAVERDFGVAPSTLRYMSSNRKAKTAAEAA